jgi:hypothetical protein
LSIARSATSAAAIVAECGCRRIGVGDWQGLSLDAIEAQFNPAKGCFDVFVSVLGFGTALVNEECREDHEGKLTWLRTQLRPREPFSGQPGSLELFATSAEPLWGQAPPCLLHKLAEVCFGDPRKVDEDGVMALVVRCLEEHRGLGLHGLM